MTTFQAVVYSIVQGFTEFLPVGANAHRMSLSWLLDWPLPSDALLGAMFAAGFLALLVYFRHDWASMISSLLQVILFRRMPMTLDERMPLFLLLCTAPAGLLYLGGDLSAFEEGFQNPLWLAASLAIFSIPLWLSDSLNRRNKSMFDWNWFDSLAVGVSQLLIFVPGAGRTTGALTAGFFRNYHREAAAKFVLFAAAPVLAARAWIRLESLDFNASSPMDDVSWFTLAVTFIVTLLVSLLAIDSFMKQIQKKSVGAYVAWRLALATALCGVYWYRAG